MREARLKSARILVVDDEVASTCLLTNFLSRFGFNHVRAINDPLDTFDNIEEFQPDLILLDLFMSGMDGFQIMERLKAILPHEFCLPVLALSGDSSSQNKRRALAAGATDMLNKPFDPSEMLMRIRNLLHTRFLYLELQEQNRGLEDLVSIRTHELASALSELKHSQRQALQLERLRAFGEMAGGVVHDFNNSLMSVVGYSDLLIGDPKLLGDQHLVLDYLRIMNTAGRDAANVVSRLRDFYRPRDEGDVFTSANLNAIIEESVRLTKPKWKDQAMVEGRTIDIDLDLERVPSIQCDPGEMREVATNLIFNAVDAMTGGGTITIRTRSDDSHVIWEVADTGVGMTEEIRARCLEPFFSTKGDKGTGLGLSLVFGAVKRHDGGLEIDSKVGSGATFRIRLPAQTSSSPVVSAPSSALAGPLRILVVDDDGVSRDVMANYLRADGHEVVMANNAHAAIHLLEAEEFDLLVTDYGMPGMNGTQLAEEAKKGNRRFPVLLVTGYTGVPLVMQGAAHHVDTLLAKPVFQDSLRRAVYNVMRREGHIPPAPAPSLAA